MLLAVAGSGLAVFVDVAGGPEDATADEVEVAGVGDGFRVVADGGGEDFRFVRAVFIGPGDDGGHFRGLGVRRQGFAFFSLRRDDLDARGERFAGEDLDVVVELFVDGGPVFEALGDRMRFVGEGDGDGQGGVFRSGERRDLVQHLERILASGMVNNSDRMALARWARCLGAEAGAAYLLDILEYKSSGDVPVPPWDLKPCVRAGDA